MSLTKYYYRVIKPRVALLADVYASWQICQNCDISGPEKMRLNWLGVLSFLGFDGLVTPEMFGARPNTGLDDVEALSDFVQYLLDRPSCVGFMSAKTYCTSGVLPTINRSNFRILGAGKSGVHNPAPIVTGCSIQYIGDPGGKVLKVAPIEGATKQYLESVTLSGFTIDGNSGLCAQGAEILSVRDGIFDLACFNHSDYGLQLGVVTTLGDPTDLQRCRIWYNGRQWEADGVSLKLVGNPGANVSLNTIYDVDIVYKHAYAIVEQNPDHNRWMSVRLYGHPDRTVNRSWIWSGGDTLGNVTRGETVEYLTCSDPVLAGGTDSWAFPSYGNRILEFDGENSGFLQAIVIETDAKAWWTSDATPIWDGTWTPYTPTITPETGTFATVDEVSGRYQRTAHGYWVFYAFRIAAKGTAGGNYIKVSLPITNSPESASVLTGREPVIVGEDVSAFVPVGEAFSYLVPATGTIVFNDGATYIVGGHIETNSFDI